jgi:hypothetical protein
VRRYYYYKCARKTKQEAGACPGADLRADMIDNAFVGYFRQLARQPEQLAAVLTAVQDLAREGAGPLETERNRLLKELGEEERQARVLIDRLADPALAGLEAVKAGLAEIPLRELGKMETSQSPPVHGDRFCVGKALGARA